MFRKCLSFLQVEHGVSANVSQMGLERKWSLAYVRREVGRAAEGFELSQRHRGLTTEKQGVEGGRNDVAETSTKTTKSARKCDPFQGRCCGMSTAWEMGKNLRVIQH